MHLYILFLFYSISFQHEWPRLNQGCSSVVLKVNQISSGNAQMRELPGAAPTGPTVATPTVILMDFFHEKLATMR